MLHIASYQYWKFDFSARWNENWMSYWSGVYKQTQQDTRLAKQDSTVKSIVKKLKWDCGYESRKMGTNINSYSMMGFMTK